MHIQREIGSADPAVGPERAETDAAVFSDGSHYDGSDGETGNDLHRGRGDVIDRIMKSFCSSLDAKIGAIRDLKKPPTTRRKMKKTKAARASHEGQQGAVRSLEQLVPRIDAQPASAAAPGSGTLPLATIPAGQDEPARTRARMHQRLVPPPAPSAPPAPSLTTLQSAPPAPAPRALALDEATTHARPSQIGQALPDSGALLSALPDFDQGTELGISGPVYADFGSERPMTPGHQALSQTATIVPGPELSIPDLIYTASASADGQFLQEVSRTARESGPVQPQKGPQNAVEEDEDGDGRRKRTKRAPLATTVGGMGGKKFACPYFKRNPRRYRSWTSCPGPGWEEVHRVKTHLYRRHPLPIQCPRCWDVFKTDGELQSHLQKDPPCAVQTLHTLHEGFTKDQEKRLRSRKKTHADMSDEDKWREIYTVLFPDDNEDSIPSPYYAEFDNEGGSNNSSASGELDDYATFIRREMPTLVRRELEALFCDEFQDVEERVRPRIAEIVLDLQPRLLSLYRQSQMPLSAYGPEQHGARASGSEPSLTPSLSQASTAETTTHTTPDADHRPNSLASGSEPKRFSTGADPTATTGAESDGQGQDHIPVLDDTFGLGWDIEFDNLLDPALWQPGFAETYTGVH